MKGKYKKLLSCLCAAALLVVGGAISTLGNTEISLLEPVKIHGVITKTDNGGLTIDNTSGNSYAGEIRINISEETRIIDAVTGFPVAYEDMRDGETAYIYIGHAMTMSIPPMTNASLILCNIPAGFRVPEFLTVNSLSLNTNQTAGTITATNGATYEIAEDTVVIPYLTRNLVTVRNLTKGTNCLLWSDYENNVTKVVVFPENSNSVKTGWVQEGDAWYYLSEDGIPFTGWLQENDDWYYLSPDTGVMKTGFVTVEGKTYYMQDNGKMLTKAKTFTPDANGVLH